MKTTALIMAGGRGERFWPKSRKSLPKQFLSLTDDGKTMIQLTVERISPLVDIKDVFISTNKDYKNLVLEQLPDIPEENILCEPIGRNTAPCIGLAAVHASKKYEDAAMIVLPSDHLIKYTKMFIRTLEDALLVADEGDNLVTIGITPDYPETGYGYIKFDPNETKGHAYGVDRFVEKPSLAVAKEYLETEEYLWNSGMFVWKADTILSCFKQYLPDMYKGLCEIQDAIAVPKNEKQIGEKTDGMAVGADDTGINSYDEILERVFPDFESVSIDYGILEKAQNIYTIPGSFGWDDVGSWLAVGRIKTSNEQGNVVDGNVITIDSRDNIIQGGRKLIAAVGLKNLIIVDSDDATLICDKDSAGDIKKVLENLKICNRDEYI